MTPTSSMAEGSNNSGAFQNTQQLDAPGSIIRVGVRTPFWKSMPDLWFVQMEAQFRTSGILLDETKYNYIIHSLNDDSLSEVSDIVLNPPATEKYETLKNRLIKSYAESAQKKLRTLLSDIDLGDRKPSQLLRRMRDLAQQSITDEVLKSLWLQRLPPQLQAILSASSHDLELLSQLADRVTEVITPSVNNVASAQPISQNLTGLISWKLVSPDVEIVHLDRVSRETDHAQNPRPKWQASVGIIRGLAPRLSNVLNPAIGRRQVCRKTNGPAVFGDG